VVVAVVLPTLSSVFGLYERVQHWGKLVHGADGFCAALAFGMLLLAWRDEARVDLSDELCGLVAVFFGIGFGVAWEIVEFIRDWVAYSDVEKSNSDTMTDFLCNDVAAIVAALLAVRLYCRVLAPAERRWLGRTATRLVDGPSRLLDHHGLAVAVIALLAIGASIALLWFADRPVPGIPIP
jgi:hypothetical protein